MHAAAANEDVQPFEHKTNGGHYEPGILKQLLTSHKNDRTLGTSSRDGGMYPKGPTTYSSVGLF